MRDATIDFQPLNVIIGANGSGKSNLISVFRLLNAMFAHEPGFRNYVGASGGADSLLHFGRRTTRAADLELVFETHAGQTKYTTRWSATAQDSLMFSNERVEFLHKGASIPHGVVLGTGHIESSLPQAVETRSDEAARTALGLLRGCRLFHFHDTSDSAAIRGPAYIEANRFLYPDAGNLSAILYLFQQQHPTVLNRIVAAAKQMIPGFHSFLLEPSRLNDRQIHLKWFQRGNDYELGSHQLSDGSIRFLALCTLFSQPAEMLPLLIAIDEPELGLHPAALEVVAGMIKAAANQCQVVLATQSATFLDHFAADDVIVAQTRDGVSEFQRLCSDALQEWLVEYSLGEVWEKNVVGGGPYG